MTIKQRLTKVLLVGIPSAIVLLTLLAVLGVYDITAPYRYHWQLVDRLDSVSDRQSAEEAVGSLGVVLDHPDGAWTAITYKDAHNFGFPSAAVARRSDGRWLRSREHHCGLFMMYRGLRTDRRSIYSDIPDGDFWQGRDERFRLLHQIESESDPVRQAELFTKLDFDLLR